MEDTIDNEFQVELEDGGSWTVRIEPPDPNRKTAGYICGERMVAIKATREILPTLYAGAIAAARPWLQWLGFDDPGAGMLPPPTIGEQDLYIQMAPTRSGLVGVSRTPKGDVVLTVGSRGGRRKLLTTVIQTVDRLWREWQRTTCRRALIPPAERLPAQEVFDFARDEEEAYRRIMEQ